MKHITLSIFIILLTVFTSHASDFENGSDNVTVTDLSTNLMWTKYDIDTNGDQEITLEDKVTWKKALEECEKLEHAGYEDWRLPTIKELHTLTDFSGDHYDPATDTTIFLEFQITYWSSTTFASEPSEAWFINFWDGRTIMQDKSKKAFIRPVRTVTTENSE